MTSEVIIDVQPKDISIALLEDKQLVEYQQEQRTASFSVGNIYVAKVKKLMPGLNACFVDVGAERVAFLHFLDLGAQFNSYDKYLKQVVSDRKKLYPIQKAHIQPELKKDGSIATTLKVGQEVLVQIIKEPINTKGPRQRFRFHENQARRRAQPTETTHPEHQAQELRCHRAYGG